MMDFLIMSGLVNGIIIGVLLIQYMPRGVSVRFSSAGRRCVAASCEGLP